MKSGGRGPAENPSRRLVIEPAVTEQYAAPIPRLVDKRNRIVLTADVLDALGLSLGDFVRFDVTPQGKVWLSAGSREDEACRLLDLRGRLPVPRKALLALDLRPGDYTACIPTTNGKARLHKLRIEIIP